MRKPLVEILHDLLNWMQERQRIYLLREAGERPPWTQDPILGNHRFTNVYREQDATTVWIRRNWREPYADHQNLWFGMAVARWINWPASLAEIGFPERWQPDKVCQIMKARQKRGETVFSSAYRRGQTNGEGGSTDDAVMKLTNLFRNADPKRLTTSIESATRYLMKFDGYSGSGFFAYEPVTDLRWTRYLCNAPDIMTWANPGPGCIPGLNRIFNRPLKTVPCREQLVSEMRSVMSWTLDHRDPAILPTLELRDVEHSLCEYRKYKAAQDELRAGKRVTRRSFRPALPAVPPSPGLPSDPSPISIPGKTPLRTITDIFGVTWRLGKRGRLFPLKTAMKNALKSKESAHGGGGPAVTPTSAKSTPPIAP